MRWFSLFLLLFIAVLLESTVVMLPITFIILLCQMVVFTNSAILIWAFFTGIILDASLLHILGARSLFFLILLAIIFLYQRKFEIQRFWFVFIFSFFGSLFYGWLFEYSFIFPPALVSAVLSICVFSVMQVKFFRKNNL